MAEVVMAVGFLALTVLTLLGLSMATIRSNDKGFSLAPAGKAADRLTEQQIYQVQKDSPPGTRASFWGATGPWRDSAGYGNLTMGGVTYEWTISLADLSDTSGVPLGTAAGEPGNRAKKVNATVWWSDSRAQGGQRQGYGRMELQATRLINENGP